MIARSEAEEHLRVIRALMEKATIYRALSAPSALAGGVLSLAASAFLMWYDRNNEPADVNSNTFTLVWSIVFFATAGLSLIFIWRDSLRRGEPFLSVGFRSAMRAALPAMLFAGIFTLAHFQRQTVLHAVPWWISFYGLALLSMAHFAPRSIALLGWAFLIAGAISVGGLLDQFLGSQPRFGSDLPVFVDGPCLLMAATFGLFHLIYAVCTWPRGQTPSP